MKRQPKPFSVEIKRSRRSGSTPASSLPVAFEMERADAEEAAPPPLFAAPPGEFDLVVPEFLKSSNGSRRLSSKENSDAAAKDREKVFAPPVHQPSNTGQQENRAQPRVLQSLEQPEADHFPIEAKLTKRTPGTNEKPTGRKPRVQPKTDAAGAFVTAKPKAPESYHADEELDANEELEAVFLKAPIEPQLTRPRIFLKNGRADAATLPPGQRWKRRLHPRTW
jgi:hypothetical protein